MDRKTIKGTKTRDNLMKAFAGESMARNRYTIFSSIAKKEGYTIISEIFLETANNEKEHAEIYYKFLDGEDVEINSSKYPSCYGDTKANLECAAKYEYEEHKDLYPHFSKIALEEGFEEISQAFNNIANIEKNHAERYSDLLNKLNKNTLYKKEEKTKWHCSHCGFMVEDNSPPEKCPVCSKTKDYYTLNYKRL